MWHCHMIVLGQPKSAHSSIDYGVTIWSKMGVCQGMLEVCGCVYNIYTHAHTEVCVVNYECCVWVSLWF